VCSLPSHGRLRCVWLVGYQCQISRDVILNIAGELNASIVKSRTDRLRRAAWWCYQEMCEGRQE
jgi:hypothetical protein